LRFTSWRYFEEEKKTWKMKLLLSGKTIMSLMSYQMIIVYITMLLVFCAICVSKFPNDLAWKNITIWLFVSTYFRALSFCTQQHHLTPKSKDSIPKNASSNHLTGKWKYFRQ
jgi:pheromone shutdown protein TraB